MGRRGDDPTYTEGERLSLFVDKTDELLGLRLVTSGGLRSHLGINAPGVGQPIELTTSQPDEELLRSFLLTFRQFVAEGEPINVNNIHNLLRHRLEGDEWRRLLDDRKVRWRNTARTGFMKLVINEDQVPNTYSTCGSMVGISTATNRRPRPSTK